MRAFESDCSMEGRRCHRRIDRFTVLVGLANVLPRNSLLLLLLLLFHSPHALVFARQVPLSPFSVVAFFLLVIIIIIADLTVAIVIAIQSHVLQSRHDLFEIG